MKIRDTGVHSMEGLIALKYGVLEGGLKISLFLVGVGF